MTLLLGQLIQVEDVAVRVGEHCHEAAPGLLRGNNGEPHPFCIQVFIRCVQVGDPPPDAGVSADKSLRLCGIRIDAGDTEAQSLGREQA